eukprot:GAHX01000870.1.p1 GENE.GAHX01000870.1~~GAHX01000870.1.p1  ORF type:complete len:247 (+),score=51.82 GAHX01000870.1:36-776(+)
MAKFTNSFRRTLLIVPKHLPQGIKEVANIFKILKFPNFVLYTQKVSLADGYGDIEKLLLAKKCDSFILFNQKKLKETFNIVIGRMFNNFLFHTIKLSITLSSVVVTNKKAEFIDSAVPAFSFLVKENELLKSIFVDVFRNSYEYNETNLFQKLVLIRQFEDTYRLNVVKLNSQTKTVQEEFLKLEFVIVEENNFETQDTLEQAYPKEEKKSKKSKKIVDDDIHGKVGWIYTTKQDLNEVNRHKRVR